MKGRGLMVESHQVRNFTVQMLRKQLIYCNLDFSTELRGKDETQTHCRNLFFLLREYIK